MCFHWNTWRNVRLGRCCTKCTNICFVLSCRFFHFPPSSTRGKSENLSQHIHKHENCTSITSQKWGTELRTLLTLLKFFIPSSKVTWQQNMDLVKMYEPYWKWGIFQPAMLVHQRVTCRSSLTSRQRIPGGWSSGRCCFMTQSYELGSINSLYLG